MNWQYVDKLGFASSPRYFKSMDWKWVNAIIMSSTYNMKLTLSILLYMLITLSSEEVILRGSLPLSLSSFKWLYRPLEICLGVEENKLKKGILLPSYINYNPDLLAKTTKIVAKPCSTLVVPNMHLMRDNGKQCAFIELDFLGDTVHLVDSIFV